MSTVINLTIHRLPRGGDNSFTMIPNSILRDPNMSCKAKAVLMYLLGEKDNSYPPSSNDDVWTMTIKGLTAAFKESVGSIKRSLDELMSLGYLVRTDILNKRNLRVRSEYTIYEEPIENPDGKPLKRYEDEEYQHKIETIKKEKEIAEEVEKEAVEATLKTTMNFEWLANEYGYDVAHEIIKIVTDAISSKHRIWLNKFPTRPSDIAKKIYTLDHITVAEVIERIAEQPNVRNRDKYILASLYSAGKKINIPTDDVARCVTTMKQFILAYKNNEHIRWWNKNNTSLSVLKSEAVHQFISDKYRWDNTAYNNIISEMQNF